MRDPLSEAKITRREMLETTGKALAASAVLPSFLGGGIGFAWGLGTREEPLNALAGVDRVVMVRGKTYLNAWAGYGEGPERKRPRWERRREEKEPEPAPSGPPPKVVWEKESGPGAVSFADPSSAVTTATFSAPGAYVLKLTANNGEKTVESRVHVKVVQPPPEEALGVVYTKPFRVDSPLWSERVKTLMTVWIPHCIAQMERTDLPDGAGGIDNFIEAAKAQKGLPHGKHKGYVFSNAWVHQTVEAMSIALMVDAQGDPELEAAQAKMRATLDDWIPIILAAREPDGYLQTAYTLRDRSKWKTRWSPEARGNHEGYTAGYFLESAINHYLMTNRQDSRLYDAAKKLADCWADHIGPPPKQEWFDGHEEMEMALVRFGRFVNDMEGGGKGDRYISLAKFLLDCRKGGTEYDQSHLPVVQQYEAVGHAVRAVYLYSGMADVAVETHDVDYQSAVRSLWDNLTNRKYYLTGGVGSGETSEGFGPDYSLRNNSYCETCASCGEIFFQWKMHLAYHDARYVDLYEETFYNGLLGSLDHEGKHYYYDNPLADNASRAAWHTCPCCVGNLSRTLLMLPTWTYTKTPDSIFVNLFIGSTATVEGVAGTDVEMVQKTNYPWDGRVAITVNPKERKRFSVRVRMPTRNVSELYEGTPRVEGLVSLKVNGYPQRPEMENGYAVVTREWKKGDTIEVELPMKVQRIRASEKVEADRGRVALRYGPLIYNVEQVDQPIDGALARDAQLTPEWRGDLLGGVTVIRGRFADGTPFMAVPNYVRYNRQPTPAPEYPVRHERGTPPPPPTSIIWMREA